MQQPLKQRAPQREHYLGIDEPLAVVSEGSNKIGKNDHGEEGATGQMQPMQARRRIQLLIEQHAIHHESHEQRLDHLQTSARQSNYEESANRITMRPEPAQILAHVFPPLALLFAARFRPLQLAFCLRRLAVLLLFLATL